MDRPWLRSYPPGVPADIDPARYPSLVALLDEAVEEFALRPAFDNFGARLSYREFDACARALAAYLQQICGITRGARVALMMPNVLAYPVALAAVLRAGGVVVNVNPLYTARELAEQLDDAGARTLVIFDLALPTLAAARLAVPLEHVLVVRLGDFMGRLRGWLVDRAARRRAPVAPVLPAAAVELREAVARGRELPFTAPALDGGDLAFLQYTGGTTGRARGAMLTHRNVVANIVQILAWFEAHTRRGHEIIITALPLYHIYALTGNCFTSLAHGGLNVLITDPRDVDRFVRELGRVPFTSVTGVNTLFRALLDHPGFARLDFSRLKFANAGGMAVQRVVAERWQAVTNTVLIEGYGLTEASPVVSINRFDADTFTGSIGLPLPSTEIRIVDEQGEPTAAGAAGELQVRGPQVMRGYWNAPADSAQALDAAGWLRTGDIARSDAAGYLYLVDRKKDVIVVSGFNVYPNEVEDIAAAHPGVREAAAVGVADAHSGEAVLLVVVRAEAALDEAGLLAWCRERLAAYKVPRSVMFVDELPKSAVGKILRREVRREVGPPGAA